MLKQNLWTIRTQNQTSAPQLNLWTEPRLIFATGDPENQGERTPEELRERRSEIISQLSSGGLSEDQETTLKKELQKLSDKIAQLDNKYLEEFKKLGPEELQSKYNEVNSLISPYYINEPTDEAKIKEFEDLKLQRAALKKLQSSDRPDKDVDQADQDIQKLESGQSVTSAETLTNQIESLSSMIEKNDSRMTSAYTEWRGYLDEIKSIDGNISNLQDALKNPSTVIHDNSIRQRVYDSVIKLHEDATDVFSEQELEWFMEGGDSNTAPLSSKIAEVLKVAIDKAQEQREETYGKLFESMETNYKERLQRLESQWNNPDIHKALLMNKKVMMEKISAARKVVDRLHTLRSLKPGTPAYNQAIQEMMEDPQRQAAIHQEIELLEEKIKRYERAIARNQKENKKSFALLEKYEQQMNKIKEANNGLEPSEGDSKYEQYQELKKDHQRLDYRIKTSENEAKLERAVSAVKKRIENLRTSRPELTPEGHLNFASLINNELRDMERQTIDDLASVEGVAQPEKVPDWEELKEKFRKVIEEKEVLMDRGAPKEITDFEIALKNIEKIKKEGLVGKIHALLNQQNDLDDFPEQKKEQLDQLEALNQTINNLPGVQNLFATRYKIDDLKKLIASGKTPSEDHLHSLQDTYNNLRKDVNNTKEIVDTYKHGFEKVNRYYESLKSHIDSGKGAQAQTSVRWLTPYDIKQMWDTFFEWSKRRYKRASDERTGDVGEVLFKNIPMCETLAYEFGLQKEQAEMGEVNKLKENFDSRDAWALWDLMEKVQEKDHLRALITSLADKGRFDIDNPILWKALARVSGGAVSFNYNNVHSETNDMVVLKEKLNRAFMAIWGDNALFREMYHKHKSAYKSELDNYKDDAKTLGSTATDIAPSCSRMLQEWIQAMEAGTGPPEGFEPHRYEGYVRYATEAGKMAPEAKIYYVIQGVRWGILSRDRLGEFSGDYTGDYPVMEFFDRSPPISMSEIEEWCKIDGPPASYGPGIKFKSWFHNYLLTEPMINERVNQRFDKGQFLDHDDTSAFITIARANSIQTLLRWRGSGGGFESSGRQNIAASMLFGLQCRAIRMNKDPEKAPQDFTEFLNSWMRFYSISTSLIHKNSKDYVKLGEEMLDAPPRVGGAYATNLGSTRNFLNYVKDKIIMVDPVLFGAVFNRDIKFKERFDKIRERLNSPKYSHGSTQDVFESIRGDRELPTNDEQLHEQFMGDLIEIAIKNNSEPGGTVDRMLQGIQDFVKNEGGADILKAIADPQPMPTRRGDRRVIVPPF